MSLTPSPTKGTFKNTLNNPCSKDYDQTPIKTLRIESNLNGVKLKTATKTRSHEMDDADDTGDFNDNLIASPSVVGTNV